MKKQLIMHPMVDQTAIVGGPPQHRDWDPQREVYIPEVHETVRIGPYTTVDCGILEPTRVGMYTYILGHCNIGHDAQIAAFVEIADSTVIAGHAVIEEGVKIGVGAKVLPYRRIGKGARVGAGAVVTKDVEPFTCVAGNPARKLYDLCRGGCFKQPGEYGPLYCSYECLMDPA